MKVFQHTTPKQMWIKSLRPRKIPSKRAAGIYLQHHLEPVCSGTVWRHSTLLLILDISRGATPIVVLCENLSIDQLKFCVSCLRCYWYRAHRYLWRSCPVWHAITAHQLRCNVSPVTVHLSCWVERLKAPSNSQQRWLMWTRGRAETPSCGVRHRATEP